MVERSEAACRERRKEPDHCHYETTVGGAIGGNGCYGNAVADTFTSFLCLVTDKKG